MRVSLRYAPALFAALLALSSSLVDGVATCADCPSGKTCLLEDTALQLGAGQQSLALKFCNFDAAQSSSYALTFGLKKPLRCDPNATLVPVVTSLTPSGDCTPANCVVTAALKAPVDWALLLKNEGDVSVLQAKLAGSDESVQVAKGTDDVGATAVTGNGNANASVCSASFNVNVARLSTFAACNPVTLCLGQPADTVCKTAVTDAGKVFVDDVECKAEACTGTIALVNALPCDAGTGDKTAVLVSVTVGNGAGSGYASIATLAAASAATISSVSGATVGSAEVTIETDATCSQKALVVTVDGLDIQSVAPANGSVVVSLASPLTSKQVGDTLDVSVAQCSVKSDDFPVTVTETGDEAAPTPVVASSGLNASATGSGAIGDVGDASPTGSQTTQQQNASTGLPHGLYIAIGVGVLAALGFAVECCYHRRRHRHEHGGGNAAHV